MSLTPSTYVERLRRDAKNLRKSGGLTHTKALDAIAAQQGQPHWKALMAAHAAGTFPSRSQLAAAPANVAYMSASGIEKMLRDHFANAVDAGTILPAIDHQHYAGPLSEEGMDIPDWFADQFPNLPDLHSDLVHEVGWDLEADGPWVHRDEVYGDLADDPEV